MSKTQSELLASLIEKMEAARAADRKAVQASERAERAKRELEEAYDRWKAVKRAGAEDLTTHPAYLEYCKAEDAYNRAYKRAEDAPLLANGLMRSAAVDAGHLLEVRTGEELKPLEGVPLRYKKVKSALGEAFEEVNARPGLHVQTLVRVWPFASVHINLWTDDGPDASGSAWIGDCVGDEVLLKDAKNDRQNGGPSIEEVRDAAKRYRSDLERLEKKAEAFRAEISRLTARADMLGYTGRVPRLDTGRIN